MANLKQKKKKLILLLTSFTTMVSVAMVALFSSFNSNGALQTLHAGNDFTLTLTNSNGGTGFPSSYGSGVNNNAKTNKGNEISFTYNNVKSTSNKYCTIANGGYLYNSTVITGLESVNVSFTGGTLSLYSSKTTTFSGDPVAVTNNSDVSISPNFDYFKLVASGETVINSVTILYTCATRPEISEVTDVITADDLTAKTTQYSDFSGVTKSSSAVYAGSSAKNSSNIQIKSDNSNTGIISTTSGGTITSVKITVANGTKTINVYGSATAYTTVGELFNTTKQGTLVGSVSSTGTINFTGDNANFTYVGIRSSSGAVYISSIEITWNESGGSGGGDTPTPTPQPGEVDLTATFPYSNPEPSSINVLDSNEQVFSTLTTSISNVQSYDDTYEEYFLAKNAYILITNANPNVTIASIDVKVYKYLNFDVFVDGSSTPTYQGDGSQGSGDPVVVNVEVNASSSVKIVCNGGGTSTSYQVKIYGVDLYLKGIQGDVSATGVSLNKTSTTIAEGESEQLTATVAPVNATNKNVSWSTSNGNVATVSDTGLVNAVAAGSATITVTTEDGGFTATCDVTVSQYYHVTSVSLSPTVLALHPGEESNLVATISPSNATNKNVNWTTSNSNVATVNGGTVTAVAAGSATITVTTVDGNKTATCSVTVTNISVTGVTLNKTSLSLFSSNSETLTATIAPSNATNKNVNWSSSNSSIATVNNGTVTAIAQGTATITAASAENPSINATCTVTVSPATDCTIDLTAQGFTDGQEVTTVTSNPFTLTFAQGSGSNPPKYYNSGTSVRTYANNTLTVATSGSDKITKIEFTLGNTATAIPSPDTGTYDSSTKTWTGDATSIRFTTGSSGQYHYKTVKITVTPSVPVVATGVNLPSTYEVGIGSSSTPSLTYTPSNANTGLDVTWSKRSGSSNISVNSSGKVSVNENASTTDTAIIRVTLTSNGSYAECTINVIEVQKAKYTVLLYLCGSTLEYDSDYKEYVGAASDDMSEILAATGTYKDDVNFVIETGGSQKWVSTHGVSNTKLEVRHVSGSSYVKDSPSTITSQANMGEASTLQTFLEYGLTTYPAEKTALILWDHGGAMTGVCCDDNYNMDALTAAEVKSAVGGALSNCGMSGQKLEWIGYDACLMGVADIASINSDYFNYMVASEESEPGDGWDYESWLPTMYNNPDDTPAILNQITLSYKNSYNSSSQTNYAQLAAYNLSYIPSFTTAFENFAGQLSSNNWDKLTTAINNSLRFGADDGGEYFYGIADMKDFMQKVAAQISSLTSYTSAVINVLDNLIISNEYGNYYNNKTKPCGICVFLGGYAQSTQYYSYTTTKDYTSNDTKFSTWRSYCINNGEWAE